MSLAAPPHEQSPVDSPSKRRKVDRNDVPTGVGYANKNKGYWRVQFWTGKDSSGHKIWKKGGRFSSGGSDQQNRAAAIAFHVKNCPNYGAMHAACGYCQKLQ